MKIHVIKRASDPHCAVRVSVGGGPQQAAYYCIYRGSKDDIILALESTLKYLSETVGEPDVTPEPTLPASSPVN